VKALAHALRRASEALRSEGLDYALVGGLAVSARVEPRFTRDVDVAVAVRGDEDEERFVRSLIRAGWRVVAQVEQDLTARLSAVRTLPPGSDDHASVVVDFLFASSGIEPEVVAAAEPLEVVEGAVLPVATAVHLAAMKVLSMDEGTRIQDRVDALALLRTLDAAGLADLRAAFASVTERDFHRGKDLDAELDDLLRVLADE